MEGIHWRWLMGLITLCLLTARPAPAAAPEFQITPAPPWVRPVALPAAGSAPAGSAVQYVLSDTQTRIETRDKVVYRHYAQKALNGAGVDEASHVEVRFDPTFQSLSLHAVNVLRNGQVLPRLDASKVRMMQRERELEYRIYDGSKTATVIVDDVRVGDVVEYAYTLRGSNPAFENRQSGRFDLQWGVPVQRIYARLLVPKERVLQWLPRNQAAAAVITEHGDLREHVWDIANSEGKVVEPDAPAWFDPYASMQWSEFKSWSQVARWAVPLYRSPTQLSPALQAEVTRIAALSAEPQERVRAVLQFVQREVRYLGVEIGAGSYIPNPPATVLKRRFGDCKDKTLLTITLLRALGIDAKPALVHTSVRQGLVDILPTPAAFNHVLVLVQLEGQRYWLDPTRAVQRAKLSHLSQADFGLALVVDAEAEALVAMAGNGSNVAMRTIKSVFDAQAGPDQAVRLTITTLAQGASAEAMRGSLSTESHAQLQKKYLNFYAQYYPAITVQHPFTVDDDEAGNRITLTERYSIANFWTDAEQRKRREAMIYVPDLQELLRQPRTPIRSSPLALAHPVVLTHTAEVLLPGPWSIKPERTELNDAAFHFERDISMRGTRLMLEDKFSSRAAFIAPTDVKAYAANLERARDAVNFQLYTSTASPGDKASGGGGYSGPAILVALLTLALSVWGAFKLYRFDPEPEPAVTFAARYQGLGGWLILLGLGLISLPIRLWIAFEPSMLAYEQPGWSRLTAADGEAFHPMWAPVLLYELAMIIVQSVALALLLVLFFGKRSSLPRLLMGYLAVLPLLCLMDVLLCNMVPTLADMVAVGWRTVGQSLVSLLIWGSYLLKSVRVRQTFVQRLRPAAPAPSEPELAPEPSP